MIVKFKSIGSKIGRCFLILVVLLGGVVFVVFGGGRLIRVRG